MKTHGGYGRHGARARRSRAVALTAGLTAAAVVTAGCGGGTGARRSSSASSTGGGTAPAPSSAAPGAPSGPGGTGSPASPGGSGGSGRTGGAGTSGPGAMLPRGYLPLWPFTSAAEVSAWQASYRSGGHQPWHLSADETALSFARGFLGFGEVDRVAGRSVAGSDARITVGHRVSGTTRTSAAGTVHLLRTGTGADAPWEVVGTDDTTFSLTAPAYGSTVRSPVTAGGRITGVDENIHLQVRRVGAASPLGSFCCLPAGGQGSAWSAKVPFSGGGGGRVLTIVAWTGGHVAAVERFAVTGARS